MNPKSFLIASLFLLMLPDFSIAQIGPPNNKKEYEKMYQRRIRKKVLNRVYIPKDMAEAFNELNKKIDDSSKQKFKTVPEEMAARRLHFSLGRWLITNWSFYEGSRFSNYINRLGLFHPDDMAHFVIIAYHRNLKKASLDIKNLVGDIQAAREKYEAAKKEKSKKVIIEETTRKRTN